MNKTILISLFLLIIYGNGMKSQVTIGSDQAPVPGAILDLKEKGVTTKGLGLPRVRLLQLTIPGEGSNLATTINQATGEWDKNAHIGMLVYNAGEYNACDPYTFPQGVYVWDGNKWQNIGEREVQSYEVLKFVDNRDNEVYLYRSFGDAGYWMLENLRFIPQDPDYPGYEAGFGDSNPLSKQYIYPRDKADTSAPDDEPDSWRPNLGLLYSYSAATMGVQDNKTPIEQGQAEEDVPGSNIGSDEIEIAYESSPGAKDGKIRGICPEGWHIPSDREWNQLEKEIYNSPAKYSQYTSDFNPIDWLPEWEIEYDNPRGSNSNPKEGHGKAMLSSCFPIGISSEIEGITGGKSLSAKQGGFDALLTGIIAESDNSYYGLNLGFWTSSISAEGDFAWGRMIFKEGIHPGETAEENAQTVTRISYARQILASVRCKKD